MSTAPSWFAKALAQTVSVDSVEVAGAAVSFRTWGEAGLPGVLLIHGGTAHARWWDHIAPLLREGRRVVAMDLSGHGDSDHRPTYGLPRWAEEVRAVLSRSGIAERPILVGHSMGGFVAVTAAMSFGSELEGIVTIDSPIRDATTEEKAARRGVFAHCRVRATKADAISRWRPVPEQEGLPYVIAHVAEHSVHEVEGGWAWKFDPGIFASLEHLAPPTLHRLDCRVAVFRAEHGLVTEAVADAMYDRLGRLAPTIELPEAGHGAMLDQPIALISALRTLIADWQHSAPLEGAPR